MTKVLIAVDGSEHDGRTIHYVARLLAGAPDLQATVLHVARLNLAPLTALGEDMEIAFPEPTEVETLQQQARDLAATIARQAAAEAEKAGLHATPRVDWGEAADLVPQIAEAEGFDLIAVGSRGAGQIAGIFLGSVSDRIAHRSKVPVLIVH